MIDKNLYCETFSQLHASEEAKKEVFQNMQEKKTQRTNAQVPADVGHRGGHGVHPLAVSAGAADLAAGGAFFRSLRQVWTDGYETRYEAVDEDGVQYELSTRKGAVLTEEDGRLMLHAAGEDIDITDELAETGAYHYEKALKHHIVAVDVAGTPEEWTLTETVTDEDGDTYTSVYTSDDTFL